MVDVRADYVEVARLAADVLSGSQQLADGWRTAQHGLAPPASAFGNQLDPRHPWNLTENGFREDLGAPHRPQY